jgi:hypothetical protein
MLQQKKRKSIILQCVASVDGALIPTHNFVTNSKAVTLQQTWMQCVPHPMHACVASIEIAHCLVYSHTAHGKEQPI